MTRISTSTAASLCVLLLLLVSSCPVSFAGLQAIFFTDSSCRQPLQYSLSDPTYIDWQSLPSTAINYNTGAQNTTSQCVAPPANIELPIPYSVASGSYNCDATANTGTLFVAEWLTAGQCQQWYAGTQSGQVGPNGPDYVYTAVVNGTSQNCTAGATYQNKSMGNMTMPLYSIVICVNNGNLGNGVSSTASVSSGIIALAALLAALVINM